MTYVACEFEKCGLQTRHGGDRGIIHVCHNIAERNKRPTFVRHAAISLQRHCWLKRVQKKKNKGNENCTCAHFARRLTSAQ